MFPNRSKRTNTLVHLIRTVKASYMTQPCKLLPNEGRRWREGKGEDACEGSTARGRRKTNNRRWSGGEEGGRQSHLPLLPPLSPFPIPLSPLTRDSFLLASHLSPPLRSSPSPGTKHTPDRLPWKRLTHSLSLRHALPLSPSLCVAAVTPVSSLSSISIPLAWRQQRRQLTYGEVPAPESICHRRGKKNFEKTPLLYCRCMGTRCRNLASVINYLTQLAKLLFLNAPFHF